MSITSPKTLSEFLDEHGLRAKKSLSQNFLIDANIISKLCTSANLRCDDFIIEIGPGPGAITEKLVESGARVVCIEKDRSFAQILSRLTNKGNLTIYNADALEFDFDTLITNNLEPGKKVKIVANLPFHITSPILTNLLESSHLIESITVIVQKEVAERFCASPGEKNYSSISLFINFFAKSKHLFNISRNSFNPKPGVDCAVLQLIMKDTLPDVDQNSFFKMTRTAFNQKRKMLRASLKLLYAPSDVEKTLEKIGLNKMARPQDLSLEKALALFNRLASLQATPH